MLFTLPVDSDSAAKQIFRNKSGGKIPAAVICFEACLRKTFRGLLHYHDIVLFEQHLVFPGEGVVGYQHVDVLELGEGIGVYLAYL